MVASWQNEAKHKIRARGTADDTYDRWQIKNGRFEFVDDGRRPGVWLRKRHNPVDYNPIR